MKIRLKHSALAVVAGALATVIEPPPPITPSAWAVEHLVVPDGEHKGQPFDLALTPYLREPMDAFGPDEPDNEFAIRKSGQTGFTLAALAGVGHSIDRDPCDMMIVQPIDSALADFISQKLGRVIDASDTLRRKITPQTARSGLASKTYEKKFGANSLFLCIATSAADLSSKTIKKAVLDEVDRYPLDVDGQGSPLGLVAGRQTMFLATGNWKRAYISTPTIKGASVIDDLFHAGDQRYWHVVCPGCRDRFFFAFDRRNFRFNNSYPYEAHYVAPCCGTIIEAWQRNGLVQRAEAEGGGWIATAPGPGKIRSYHFDALSSPFVPWDHIARQFIEASEDPGKLAPFYNLVLGLPFEVKGDAPDHAALMSRREGYRRGQVPAGALLITVACDVQMRGIYYEVLAHAPDRQTWVIDADYLDGDTTDIASGAFLALTELYLREWPSAYGGRWRADEFGVDANYRSHVVYEWTRRHPGTKALQGRDGWGHPALGIARDVDVDYKGVKIKGGAKLRGVGTWSLKSSVYFYLGREAHLEGGVISIPPGYCHFGEFLDETYFRQLTAEYLADERHRGHLRKVWKQRAEDNHFLDCRVYNLALAEAYFHSFTADDWARQAKSRGIPEDLRKPDLFKPRAFADGAAADNATAPAMPVQRTGTIDAFAALADLNRGV